jgi:flagellar secretion chaperone FliS
MYSAARKAVDAYAQVGVETGVAAADPHKLILMLFDGTLAAISNACLAMSRKEIAAKGAAISKAIAIIDGGLKASLDVNAGGELAERLAGLYDYMLQRLLAANLRNDTAILDEVTRLLNELRGAWAQIGQAGPTATVDEAAHK